jgi:methyl-accepting chemotaxis protein
MGQRWPFVESVRQSYALKIAIALVSVIALTVVVGAVIDIQTEERLQADVQEELTTLSNSQSDTLDTWMGSVKTQTKLTSKHPVLQSDDTDRIQGHLKGLVADETVPDGVVAIHYYDTESDTIVTSSNDKMVGVSPGEQGALFATNPPTYEDTSGVHVSAPFRVPVVDFPVVAVVSPVPDQPNKRAIYMINIAKRTQSLTGDTEERSTVVLD